MTDNDEVRCRFRTNLQQPGHWLLLTARSQSIGEQRQRDPGGPADPMISVDEQSAGRVLTREGEGRSDLLFACHADVTVVCVDILEVEHEMWRV